MKHKHYFFTLLLVLILGVTYSQTTTVSGTVYDNSTGETLPFATVKFKGTTVSVTTDIDGNYTISTSAPSDLLVAISFGFSDLEKSVKKGEVQVINFKMGEVVNELQVVEIKGTENPAHKIIRKVIENKDDNNIKKLDAYESETYSKVELDIDNISQKFKQKKFMKTLSESFDNMGMVTDEDGREVLPIFISETMSEFYYKRDPKNQLEKVKATRVTGIGIEDGSFVSQLVGSSFQQFNFYENSVNILGKDFVSPFASGWKGVYRYIIEDTVLIDGFTCYELEIYPKREQDLGFKGKMWVVDSSYAIKKVDFTIPKEANINFIDEIKLRQEWMPTDGGAWFVSLSRLTIDVGDLNDDWASMVLKSTISNTKLEITEPKENKFYEYQIEVAEDAGFQEEGYWDENRPYELTKEEEQSFVMVDSLRNMPSVKTYIDIIFTIINGYKTMDWFDIGPYLFAYSWNEVEGHKVRLGGRTNESFHRKWVLEGYVAPSLKDEKIKYGLGVKYIFDRTPWTELGLNRRYDLDQLGVPNDLGGNLYQAFIRWGRIVGPHYTTENNLYLFRQLNKNFSSKIQLSQRLFDPIFNFSYYDKPGDTTSTRSQLNSTYATIKLRYAKNELFIQQGNTRRSLGSEKLPEITLNYTMGLKGVLGADFDFQKLDLVLEQRLGVGKYGETHYWAQAGKVFSTVPFPLLNVHLGNESPIYVNYAFSLLDNFEFVSDNYGSFNLAHHFNGYILNKIPVMKKLKWRAVTNFQMLYGTARQENFDIIPSTSTKFSAFEPGVPYMEVGYGVENIFRFLRVQAFHRLTYRDRGRNNWAIKGTLQLTL